MRSQVPSSAATIRAAAVECDCRHVGGTARPYNRIVRRLCVWPFLAVALSLCINCGPTEPLKVETIQLGRSLNPDGSVAGHTSNFKPLDTMYVSVLTTDKGRGTIAVKWVYEGRLVSDPSKEV